MESRKLIRSGLGERRSLELVNHEWKPFRLELRDRLVESRKLIRSGLGERRSLELINHEWKPFRLELRDRLVESGKWRLVKACSKAPNRKFISNID